MTWVFLKTGTANYPLWTVGFYDPKGDWQPESDHPNKEDAAKRCHFLNGGHEQEQQLNIPNPLRSVVNAIGNGAFR